MGVSFKVVCPKPYIYIGAVKHLLFVRVTEFTGRSKRINVMIEQFTNEFRCTVLRNVDTVGNHLLPESFRPRLKPVYAVLPVCDGIKGCHARRSHWQKSGRSHNLHNWLSKL